MSGGQNFGGSRPPYRPAVDDGKGVGAIGPLVADSKKMCFEYISGGTCRTGDSCPHRHVTAAQYQAIKDAKRAGSRARGSVGVCLFRGRTNLGRYSSSSSSHGSFPISERWPSILAVGRDILADNRPIGLDPEDFEEESVPTDQPSSIDGDEARMLSDDSSRVSEGQMEDWGEWELDSDDMDIMPSSGVVRFDRTDQVREVEVSSYSPC